MDRFPTGRFPHRSPDVILIPGRARTFGGPRMNATHGALSYPATHIPMLFFGPGIEDVGEIPEADMVDFAPTMLTLLDVPRDAGTTWTDDRCSTRAGFPYRRRCYLLPRSSGVARSPRPLLFLPDRNRAWVRLASQLGFVHGFMRAPHYRYDLRTPSSADCHTRWLSQSVRVHQALPASCREE